MMSLRKKKDGSPLLIINSISCTLLLKEKTEIISNKINKELKKSCLKIYFSTKFIDILKKKQYTDIYCKF